MPPGLRTSTDVLTTIHPRRPHRVDRTCSRASSTAHRAHIRNDVAHAARNVDGRSEAARYVTYPSCGRPSRSSSADQRVAPAWIRGRSGLHIQLDCPGRPYIDDTDGVAIEKPKTQGFLPRRIHNSRQQLKSGGIHARKLTPSTGFRQRTHEGSEETNAPAVGRSTTYLPQSSSVASGVESSFVTGTSPSHFYIRCGSRNVNLPQTNALILQRSGYSSVSRNTLPSRLVHGSARQGGSTAATQPVSDDWPTSSSLATHPNGIRAALREWQVNHAHEEKNYRQIDFEPEGEDMHASDLDYPDQMRNQNEEDEDKMYLAEESDNETFGKKFLQPGDLVELQHPQRDHESIVAVFIRDLRENGGLNVQLFSMTGKWVNVGSKTIQNTIKGWAKPSEVDTLIPYLPSLDAIKSLEDLKEAAYFHDLSVPRRISAPLIRRMIQFHAESQALYRRHASVLDRAHELLAHETDLRHGTVASAASTLLRIPEDRLPLTALWATRRALVRAGTAFRFDPRSHRITGFVQIRSKQQVSTIVRVRDWFRIWQDDMAKVSIMSERHLARHRTPKEAGYLYGFIKRASSVIIESRKNRDPTHLSSVGPSQTRINVTPTRDSVRITKRHEFTVEDADILRFILTWINDGFRSDERLSALPPLVLQKTKLYDGLPLKISAGWMFLQELGTILPYENPQVLNPDLLLPSSQQSKSLHRLMSSLLSMKDSHSFKDSMASLRHDWKDHPVYCIDDSSAREIDDAISIENEGLDADGNEVYWLHTHVANPTAFFNRDHPLARMARHMTQSIYMPERAYTMLPHWVGSAHFSLASNRPCLTFSVKVNQHGKILDKAIRPGTIRNVISLTPQDLGRILGEPIEDGPGALSITIGGDVPPSESKQRDLSDVTPQMANDLRNLRRFAELRSSQRRARGELPFASFEHSMSVWQSRRSSGLPWQDLHLEGSRTVEGDPVIHFKTARAFTGHAVEPPGPKKLVQEMMLLACETAALWCAERSLPTLYRGVKPRPSSIDPIAWVRENVEPVLGKNVPPEDWPQSLMLAYSANFGYGSLSSRLLPHPLAGLEGFTKVTSPLRRYGDMITHWQIQAALLEEAKQGRSLVTGNRDDVVDQPFLPFTSSSIEAICVGLAAREKLMNVASKFAAQYWLRMMLFRAIHFGDGTLPLPVAKIPPPPETSSEEIGGDEQVPYALPKGQFYTHSLYLKVDPDPSVHSVPGVSMQLNSPMWMGRPENYGLPAAQMDDVWEVAILKVFVRGNLIDNRPLRLLRRNGVDVEEPYDHTYVDGPPQITSYVSQTDPEVSAS